MKNRVLQGHCVRDSGRPERHSGRMESSEGWALDDVVLKCFEQLFPECVAKGSRL